MPLFSHPTRALLACSCLVAAGVLASCGTTRKLETADQQIVVDPGVPVAFDIENFHGNVRIVVDPSLSAARSVIKKHTALFMEQGFRDDAHEAISVRTRTLNEEGRSVIRLKTTTTWAEPEKVWVNVTLFVPRCDGVRVWNRGGKVTLEGVSGALQVENARFAGSGAPIEVRTDKPVIDPVMLVTDSGTVAYQVGTGSSGRFTLDSADDREELDCKVLSVDQIRSDGKVTTAVVNAGENEVLLKSGEGLVTAIIMHEPMGYTNRLR
jgi:hypothetical protein